MKIFIYTTQDSNGVSVIINNLKKYLDLNGFKCSIINTLDESLKSDIILPYGVNESLELYSKGFNCIVSLLIDAISLGYLNKIKFYLSKKYFFHYDFLYSVYGYFKYKKRELNVLRLFNYVIVVSDNDRIYLKALAKTDNILVLKNGVNYPKSLLSPETNIIDESKINLGILSNWGTKQTFYESYWFVVKYFYKFHKKFPESKLFIAGRGDYIQKFNNINGVVVLGEVINLSDFFSKIDILIVPNPKGCGILNRVLDSIMYKKVILGHKNSFSGFTNFENCFFMFDSYDDFCESINMILENESLRKEYVNNSYDKALKYHSWEFNYNNFINRYFKGKNSIIKI